jgi:hypothetical protein
MSDASAEQRPLRMRHVLLTAGLLLCILMVLFWRPLAIRFHLMGMHSAIQEHDAWMNGEPRGRLLHRLHGDDLWDWYAFHRDGLVGLNALVHRQYRFDHVVYDPEEHVASHPEAVWFEQQFLARLDARPEVTGSVFGWSSGASAPYQVNIWIAPDDVADWDAWHAFLNGTGVAQAGVAAEAAGE